MPVDNSKEQPEQCDACHFKTPLVKPYRNQRVGMGFRTDPETGTHVWFCHLCAETLSGNARQWPEQYANADVLNTLCYIGNAILRELSQVRADEPWGALHALWSWAVDKPGYDKTEFMDLETDLRLMLRKSREKENS